MAISDAQFLNWLKQDGGDRIILAHLSPYTPGGFSHPPGQEPEPGSEGPQEASYFLSTRPYVTWSTDTPAKQMHDECIVGTPIINRRLSQSFIGEAVTTWGDLELDNTEGEKDSWLTDLRWDGRGIVLYVGDMSWPFADFRKVFAGVIDNIYVKSDSVIAFRLRDKRHVLDKPIQSNLFSGTGTSNDGQPKPLCAGLVFNIEPVLVNAASFVYMYHDDTDFESIDDTGYAGRAVRDRGLNVASFTHSASPGGQITLGSAPSGRVTMDTRGVSFGSPSELYWTSNTLRYLLMGRVTSPFVSTDIDEDFFTRVHAEESVNDISGIYIRERMNVIDVLNLFSPGIRMWYGFTREGLLTGGIFKPPENGTPVMTLEGDDILDNGLRHVSKSVPWSRVRVGYQKNWTPQDPDSLAGAVTVANRELYSNPYLVHIRDNPHNVVAESLLATEPPVVETMLYGVGALTSPIDGYGAEGCSLDLVGRQITTGVYHEGLFSKPRDTFEVAITAVGFNLELGDIVTIKYPRYGFNAGLPATITAIRLDPLTPRVTLEVWK